MIALIEGVIELIMQDKIIVMTASGLGYEVNIPSRMLSDLVNKERVKLFTIQVFKENDVSLYGFSDIEDILWFKSLNKISGLGPKLANSILGAMSAEQIENAIITKNEIAFQKISGLGKKIANRIVTELDKEPLKIASLMPINQVTTSISNEKTVKENNNKIPDKKSKIMDCVLALESLGFDKGKIFEISSDIYKKNPEISLESLIKNVLKTFDR